jgi:ornithine cyclodeaminase
MEKTMGIPVASASDPEAAVSSADIIVTTTAAKAPVLMADWMRSGQHITAMGSDQDDKNELDPGCFHKATLYAPDRLSQTEILGELRSAIEAGVVSPGTDFAELGDIVAGNVPGRKHPEDITICDLTGTGMQDTAIATLARERAIAAGAGLDFKT